MIFDFWMSQPTNHPSHITMRFINSEIQMMQSLPRSTEVNALIQLIFFIAYYQWHDIRFWGRLSRSNYPPHITIRFIKSERIQSPWCSTKVNALIQLILFIAQFQWHDIRFLGCLCRFNHPLQITMRFINSEFQMTQSPPRLTEVNALIQLNFFVA